MRLVSKDFSDKPAILSNAQVLSLLETLSQSADPSLINDKYYQDPYKDPEGRTQSRVRDKLNKYYFDKCAYCETYCKAQIEHYRPKKGVSNNPNHSGYYWLCYEWSNLIPSCPDCNTYGGKGNQFPVRSTPITEPKFKADGTLDKLYSQATSTYLLSEKPYLLHPELDEPIQYLGFKVDPEGEGIMIFGTDDVDQRGEVTIQICNLNRKSLKVERLNVLDNFVNELTKMFKLVADKIMKEENLIKALFLCFQQLKDDQYNFKIEHTLLRRFIIGNTSHFDAIVLPRLSPTQKNIVQIAFQLFINQT